MIKKLKKTTIAALLVTTALQAHTSYVSASEAYSDFEEYCHSMEKRRKPKVLIVGCGHGAHYGNKEQNDHSHPDCWTINLKSDPQKKGFDFNKPDNFKEGVRYDEILDITTPHRPFREVKTNENLPLREVSDYLGVVPTATQKMMAYKNAFDVIVLERPLNKTINHPWTLWNVANMLKVGGEILIDTTQGYDSSYYFSRRFVEEVYPQPDSDYPVNKNFERLAREFGLTEENRVCLNQSMVGATNYLNYWGFKDILNVGDRFNNDRYSAHQRFTVVPGQGIETARKTSLVSAFKTDDTENKMEEWARRLQKFQSLEADLIDVKVKSKAEEKREIVEEAQKTVKGKEKVSHPIKEPVEVKPLKIAEENSSNKSDVKSDIGRPHPMDLEQETAEEVTRALSSEEEGFVKQGYKVIDLPDVTAIERALREGRNYVDTQKGHSFLVQSLTGGGFGTIGKEAREGEVDIQIESVRLSKDLTQKGQYRLSTLVKIMFSKDGERSHGLPFVVKYEDPFQAYYADGFGTESEHAKVKITRNVIGADRVLVKSVENSPVTRPSSQAKTLAKKVFVAPSQGVSKAAEAPSDESREGGRETRRIVPQASHWLPSAKKENPFTSSVDLLGHNLKANQDFVTWMNAEFRWPQETNRSHFWALQALKTTFEGLSKAYQVASDPNRAERFKDKDQRVCQKGNQDMIETLNEWISTEDDLLPLIIKKGFDWQSGS